MHPVVHGWCTESISRGSLDLKVLALTVIGFAAPERSEPEYWVLQRRILPHANRCLQQLSNTEIPKLMKDQDCNDAFHNLGLLYADQDRMAEAEKMYDWALNGKEKGWGPEHISTLDTVNNLGTLYKNQGKLAKADVSLGLLRY